MSGAISGGRLRVSLAHFSTCLRAMPPMRRHGVVPSGEAPTHQSAAHAHARQAVQGWMLPAYPALTLHPPTCLCAPAAAPRTRRTAGTPTTTRWDQGPAQALQRRCPPACQLTLPLGSPGPPDHALCTPRPSQCCDTAHSALQQRPAALHELPTGRLHLCAAAAGGDLVGRGLPDCGAMRGTRRTLAILCMPPATRRAHGLRPPFQLEGL